MRTFALISILLLLPICSYGQLHKESFVRVHYLTQYKNCLEKDRGNTETILDIGKTRSCFYNRWDMERAIIADSIKRVGGDANDLMRLVADIPSPGTQYSIYCNYPAGGQRTVTEKVFMQFHYTEQIDELRWELTDRDTLILDYNCKSAQCEYRGRKWNVYYTLDIPISAGPWKLHGLPGLILYAVEDENIFSFSCIGIGECKAVLPEPDLSMSQKCTRKDVQAMKRESWESPEDYLKRFGISGKGYTLDGKDIVYPRRTAVFLDKE